MKLVAGVNATRVTRLMVPVLSGTICAARSRTPTRAGLAF
jgi:hypothetical protein